VSALVLGDYGAVGAQVASQLRGRRRRLGAGRDRPTPTERGAAFVDITATAAYVAALERLGPLRPVLVVSAWHPG
jgi:hypothetical protein